MSKFLNVQNGSVENPPSVTMDKDLLKLNSKVASSPIFSSETNWEIASFIYKKVGSNARLPVAFRNFSATKQMKLKPGMANNDNFQLAKVILSDFNRNLLILKPSDIQDLLSYNFQLQGNSSPSGYQFGALVADASIQVGGMLNVSSTLLNNGVLTSGNISDCFVEIFSDANASTPALISMPLVIINGVMNFPLPIMAMPSSPMYLAPGNYYVRARYGTTAYTIVQPFSVNAAAPAPEATMLRGPAYDQTAYMNTPIGGSSTTEDTQQGLSFLASETSQELTSVKIYLRSTSYGTKTGSIRLKVYHSSTQTFGYTSNWVDISDLTTTLVSKSFDFANPVSLLPNNFYQLLVEYSVPGDAVAMRSRSTPAVATSSASFFQRKLNGIQDNPQLGREVFAEIWTRDIVPAPLVPSPASATLNQSTTPVVENISSSSYSKVAWTGLGIDNYYVGLLPQAATPGIDSPLTVVQGYLMTASFQLTLGMNYKLALYSDIEGTSYLGQVTLSFSKP